MEVSKHLTEEVLQEILMSAYEKGNEICDIKTIDLVNEIKCGILTKCTVYNEVNPK